MRAKVKVKFSWMTDSHVNRRTRRNIATLANFIITISTEESTQFIKLLILIQVVNSDLNLPCMMTLLDNYEGNSGLIGTL